MGTDHVLAFDADVKDIAPTNVNVTMKAAQRQTKQYVMRYAFVPRVARRIILAFFSRLGTVHT